VKAVRMTAIGKPLALQEIPAPPVGPGEVLVQIKAAGICHSDAHYRAGTSSTGPLPQTLGHEIAGVVEAVGPQVTRVKPGDRVCLHYLVTCGQCEQCNRGHEQFCVQAQMLGKHRDGGYAEYIAVPERGVVHLPTEIPFEISAYANQATEIHYLLSVRSDSGGSFPACPSLGGLCEVVQIAEHRDFSHYSNTLSWHVTNVTDWNGASVGYSVASTSGFDYAPEPGALASMLVALCAIGGLRRTRGRAAGA